MKKNWFTIVALGKQTTILLYGVISSLEGDINDKDFITALQDLPAYVTNVDVRINCEGGSVPMGLSIYNAMKRSDKTITCYVDGVAGSMGSIIALGGKTVVMAKNARFMIHPPAARAIGQVRDLEATIILMKGYAADMKAIYKSKTKQSDEVIDSWMVDGVDKWFTASEALKAGLCDEVVLEYVDVEDMAIAGKSTAEIVAVYDAKIQEKVNNQTKINMLKPLLAATLGLDPNAADADFVSAVQNYKNKANSADALTAEIGTLKTQLTAQKNAEISTIVAQAVTEGKIDTTQVPTFEALLKNDFDNGKKALDAIKATVAKPVMLPSQVITYAGGGAAVVTGEKTWDDLTVKEQEELHAKDASKFTALYTAKFGALTEL